MTKEFVSGLMVGCAVGFNFGLIYVGIRLMMGNQNNKKARL